MPSLINAPGTDSRAIHPSRTLTNLLAGAVLSGALTGCGAAAQAEIEAQQNREITVLTDKLERCDDLQNFKDGGILSMGTLGVRKFYHDRENRIVLSKGVSSVDQVFMLWPPPQSPEAVTTEGDPSKLTAVEVGSYSGVRFKAEYEGTDEKKESFVIQNSMVGAHSEADPGNPGIHRYVIIIEWR